MSGSAPIRVPGQPTSKLGAIPTGPAHKTELPDIYEAQPGDAMPSICLIGESGAGKTHQLGLLIAHLKTKGLATILLSIEDKHQELARFGPKVQPIGTPMKLADGTFRVPTATEKYHRLLAFRDGLRTGRFREHGGLPVGAIVTDGLTEMGNVVKEHHMANMPVSSTSGQTNTYRAFGEIGNDLLDLMRSLKEAASDVGKVFGIQPIGIVATCVETLDQGRFRPLLPGNIAPDNYAQQFEMILRLAVESAGPNTTAMQYVAHTMPGEVFLPVAGRWSAKAPAGFEPKIVNPNLGQIFEQVVAHYRGETAA